MAELPFIQPSMFVAQEARAFVFINLVSEPFWGSIDIGGLVFEIRPTIRLRQLGYSFLSACWANKFFFPTIVSTHLGLQENLQ